MTTLLYAITGIGMFVGLCVSVWVHLETRKMHLKDCTTAEKFQDQSEG